LIFLKVYAREHSNACVWYGGFGYVEDAWVVGVCGFGVVDAEEEDEEAEG
jgi:hypothetical protein